MRDIKFEVMFTIHNQDFTTRMGKHYTTLEKLTTGNDPMDYGLIDVVAKRQFTGLKDKNGVEIYEGDILKFKWLYQDDTVYIEDKWLYGKVEFVGGKFIVRRYCSTFDIGDINQMTFERFWRESYSSAKNEYFKMIGFEVVSNIHENPELLK